MFSFPLGAIKLFGQSAFRVHRSGFTVPGSAFRVPGSPFSARRSALAFWREA
jgi:hypothetical protein